MESVIPGVVHKIWNNPPKHSEDFHHEDRRNDLVPLKDHNRIISCWFLSYREELPTQGIRA